MATYYTTVTGAGLKDGSSPANAFDATGFYAQVGIASSNQDIFYVEQGNYTQTNNITFEGSNTTTGIGGRKIVGVTDINTLEIPQTQDEMPKFIGGAYYIVARNLLMIENIFITNSATRSLYVTVDLGNQKGVSLYNVQVVNTQNSGATVYALFCGSSHDTVFVFGCYFEVDLAGVGSVACYGDNTLKAHRCSVKGAFGYRASSSHQLTECIANVSRTAVVGGYPFNILNCTFHTTSTTEPLISCTGTDIPYLSIANIFSGGNYAYVFPSSLGDNFRVNSFFTNNNFNGQASGKMSFDNGVTEDDSFLRDSFELDPQFTDPSNGDFSIGENLKAKGFPSAFPDGINTSYLDIGAVQRQEPDPVTFPDAGEVASGVDRGDGVLGTRTDANPDLVVTENPNYGNPSSPLVPDWTKADPTKYADGEQYGTGGTSETGSLSVTVNDPADVREGVLNADDVPGTLSVPAKNKVVLNEPTDDGVGAYYPADVSKVELGYEFGEDGNARVGTLPTGTVIKGPLLKTVVGGARLNATLK